MKKRLFVNLIASILAFVIQMGINFFLSPYLVEKLGNEAYGFVSLANNFVSYASILTVALNSMASRFISVESNKGNFDKANEYYSSVFIADIILSIGIALVSGILIYNLEHIINITPDLQADVKLTFALVFVNFVISILSTVFTVATFVKNRVDIASIRNIFSYILRVIILLGLFIAFRPRIYYIAIASIICSIYLLIANMKITKKIASEFKIKFSNFKISAIKTIILSGIWNSINNFSRVLLTGLDLLISNLFIGGNEMGILSIAKTIPTAIESLLATIGGAFTPHFTILYSQNKIEELIEEVKFSIKLLSLMMTVPLAGFIIFGTDFYHLWLPSKSMEEILKIQILSVLTLAPYILSAYIFTLISIDTATNQLKRPVICSLIMSIVTVITEIILLQTTNLGLYAIAGASSFYWVFKILIFNPINAAYNLKIKWNTFYPPFIRAIVCLCIIMIIFYFGSTFIIINSWFDLLAVGIGFGIIGYILNFIILLNKNEKARLINKIKEKLEKNKFLKKFLKLKNIIIAIILILLICFNIFQFTKNIQLNKNIEILNKRIENVNDNDGRYINISLDDTISIFKDLTNNEKKYKSIFQNDTLKYFKELHDKYGLVVSFYCYYEDRNFNLGMASEKFREEFRKNSEWLRFGFHALDAETKYETDEDAKRLLEDYNKTVNELIRITGGNESIDNVIRLHYYMGSLECINSIKNTENGITGLLCADTEGRISYYFDKEKSLKIYNADRYYDSGITFFNTDIRLEFFLDNLDEELEKYLTEEYSSKNKELIVFTHEWQLSNKKIKSNIEKICEHVVNNNYLFEFAEDQINNK